MNACAATNPGLDTSTLGGFFMVTLLVIITVLLFRAAVVAALLECARGPDEGSVGVHPGTRHDPTSAPAGPQDAPLGSPWDPARGPQDAPHGPQDAVWSTPATATATATAEVERAGAYPDPLLPWDLGVMVGRASTIAVARSRGATAAVRGSAAGRLVPLVRRGRSDTVEAPSGDVTEQPVLARPLRGPAYMGGRDDGEYLSGWDDAADGLRRGHEVRGPRWGSAAYMTGWNDAVRAVTKARAA